MKHRGKRLEMSVKCLRKIIWRGFCFSHKSYFCTHLMTQESVGMQEQLIPSWVPKTQVCGMFIFTIYSPSFVSSILMSGPLKWEGLFVPIHNLPYTQQSGISA